MYSVLQNGLHLYIKGLITTVLVLGFAKFRMKNSLVYQSMLMCVFTLKRYAFLRDIFHDLNSIY